MDDKTKTYQDELEYSLIDLKLSRGQLPAIIIFALGYGAVLIIWIIDLIAHNDPISVSGLLNLHIYSPALFFIDIIPFFIAYIVRRVAITNLDKEDELQKLIAEKDEIIQRNAHFAQMIGERNFSINIHDIPESDKLGKALILMRQNLAETDKKEDELNWIARGKDQISDVLRQHNNINILAYETLVKLLKYINAIQGSFYFYDDENKKLINIATYAFNRKKFVNQEFHVGEGLIGQAAFEMDLVYRKEVPDDYITITSGILGDKRPKALLIVPLISDGKLQGIIEFTTLDNEISDLTIKFVHELSDIIGQTLFNLKVNTRTERLLKEAQEMTTILRNNEIELRQNALDMKRAQEELEKSNKNLAKQIEEVENAQKRLHSLLENASEVISIYDENSIVKYVSPSVKNIMGISVDDLIGKSAFEQEDASTELLKKTFYDLLENPQEPISFEYQYEKSASDLIWLETTGRNLLHNQAIAGIIFNTRDITVRKIAERAQRMSGQMQALSENSVDMIMRVSLEGEFYYVNPVVKLYTGIETQDMTRKKLDEIKILPEISLFFKETIEKILSTHLKVTTQIDFPTKFGVRIMQVNAIPEFNEEKELETILFVAHDITEQKLIEQEIKDKNKAISDSINYAQRIQTAILPNNKVIQSFLPKSFIFYKPRDVVSGDFPWFFTKNDIIYIAAVDCTGHGVPGALLSFIGYFLLNNIVDHDRDLTAGKILDLLHTSVRKTLRQDSADANARDGMDIAFCKINPQIQEVQYAGAHRPLYYFSNGELIQFKGNPKAIGGIPNRKKEEPDFYNSVINYKEGDKIFFFSDGLTDQVGGRDGRKYQALRIRDKIVEHPDFTMPEYSDFFFQDFLEWKGENKQIDDVLLIGIEF